MLLTITNYYNIGFDLLLLCLQFQYQPNSNYIFFSLFISYTSMSLKVLCFGENQLLTRVVAKLRTQSRDISDEEIVVDNLEIKGKPFVTFSITNPQLIGSQATGTSGLLYFLDPSIPLYEQKQFFFNIVSQKREFDSLPAVIVYDKDQNLNIKQIVNEFQLFKVKDRASMIKEVDLGDRQTIIEIFSWVDNQIQFRKTKSFDAAPKIVKIKPKYRQSEPESTQKKYESIIREKKLKNLGVKAQQQVLIMICRHISIWRKRGLRTKQWRNNWHISTEIKKKMAPYDIKATPNPKIDANLHFFLKDARVDKPQQVNINIQTDQFKERPRQKPYIPKKTGVNIATQIQSTQLFDFTKEVQPILDILTTRALESAALQIEEEEEILKISKYKNAYNDRVKKQKKHEQENIDQQLLAIKEKQRILQLARKKDQTKKNTTKKQSYYALANTFLQNIYKDSAFSLYKKNLYPNQFQHALKTDYLPEVLKRSLISYDKIIQKEKCLQNVFEESCIKPIQKQIKTIKNTNKESKKQKQQRRANKGDSKRFVHIFYDSPQDKKFTSFSKYIEKQIEGNLQEYIKSREDEIQQAEDKLTSQQIDQTQATRIKQKDNAAFNSSHNSVLINNERILCFTATQNKYTRPLDPKKFSSGCLFFDRQGNLVNNITAFGKGEDFSKGVTDLRWNRDLINFDNGVTINLQKLPQKIKSVICYLKIHNIGSISGEAQIKNVSNSVYGIEFYSKSIPIFKQEIGKSIKWEQLNKPVEGGAQGQQNKGKDEQSLYVWAYHLIRKGKQNWLLQQINTISKPIKQSANNQYLQKITNFYNRSLQIFKTEDDQPKIHLQKQQSRGNKRKSKKIVEQKQIPKVQVKIVSKILKQVEINLKDDWNATWNKLGNSVTQWKQFIEQSPDGWYLQFRNKKLEIVNQLNKFSKIGDLILKKVIPVVEEQKPEVVQADGDQKPEDE